MCRDGFINALSSWKRPREQSLHADLVLEAAVKLIVPGVSVSGDGRVLGPLFSPVLEPLCSCVLVVFNVSLFTLRPDFLTGKHKQAQRQKEIPDSAVQTDPANNPDLPEPAGRCSSCTSILFCSCSHRTEYKYELAAELWSNNIHQKNQ